MLNRAFVLGGDVVMNYKDEMLVPMLLVALALELNLGAIAMGERSNAALSTIILLTGVVWLLFREKV